LTEVTLLVLHDEENILKIGLILSVGHYNVKELRREAADTVLRSLMEAPHNLDLANHLDAVVLVLREVVNELKSHCTIRSSALALIHKAEAALTKLLHKFVIGHDIEPNSLQTELLELFFVDVGVARASAGEGQVRAQLLFHGGVGHRVICFHFLILR